MARIASWATGVQHASCRTGVCKKARPGRYGTAAGCCGYTKIHSAWHFYCCFFLSFTLHALGGVQAYEDQLQHGGASVSLTAFLHSSRFRFQSFQNWQSEFLGLGAMVVLSIFLRQRGSAESKPVDAAHSDTGTE